MYQIVCTDAFGNTHDVPAEMMKLKSLAYGILIENDSVLLVQDKGTGMWEFPGGELDKSLSELEGMKRNIVYQTGLLIGQGMKLIHVMEEDYYDVNVNDGLHATRMFYTVSQGGGNLLSTGNGSTIAQAKFIPLSDVKHFSDKEMKKKYKEVLKSVTAS